MESNENDKIYFIVKDNESNGPFNIEELKIENIKPTDLVWFEGISDWSKAIEIDTLKVLFEKKTPPPIPNHNSTQNDIKNEVPFSEKKEETLEKESNSASVEKEQIKKKSSKTALWIVLGFLVLIILISLWSNYNSQNQKIQTALLEQDRIEAAVNEQKRINDENREKIEAQEKEKRRLKIEELTATLNRLKSDLDESYVELEAAKYKLNDISQFQLLRTASEKNYQIKSQIQLIKDWESHIRRIKSEIISIKAEVQSLSY